MLFCIGMNGTDGKGGLGGDGVVTWRELNVNIYYDSVLGTFTSEFNRTTNYNDKGTFPPGEKGKDGGDCTELEVRQLPFYNSLDSLNKFKFYAREHLANNVQVSNISGFLDYVSDSDGINALFNTTDFINEFVSIESHYFELRDKLSFTPYYESLRGRIVSYSQTIGGKPEVEKALNYLYTSVLSRLYALNSRSNHIAVVDILEDLKIIKNRMAKLQQKQRTSYINDYRDDYKRSLDSKIETATKLIDTMVVPKIDKTFKEVNQKIKDLLDETIAMESKTGQQLKKANENKETLITQIMLESILTPFKLASSVLSVLGPEGMIAGKAIDVGTGVAQTVIDSTLKMQTISVPTGLIKSRIIRTTELAKHDFDLLEMQLNDIKSVLYGQSLDELNVIIKTVEDSALQVETVSKSITIPNVDQLTSAKSTRTNLLKLIGDTKEKLGKREDKDEPIVRNATNALGHVEKFLKVGEVGIELYISARNDQKKLAEIDETIRKLDDQLKVIKQHEQNIYHVMIPQFKIIEETVSQAIRNAGGKSHVELDISKWAVQSSLGDIKKLFNEMTQGFLVDKDLEHCIETIKEGITTVIDVYDRVDSYTEQGQLATMITSVATGPSDIKDDNLANEVLKMESIIDANLVMEQYEEAMNALKQHAFPFAAQYVGEFGLPANSSSTDTEFTNRAIDLIDNLIYKIRETNALILRTDGYVFSKNFTDQNAFFKWNSNDYKNEIEHLLNGERVIFVADLDEGLDDSTTNLNAVKFNEIWLKFKLKTPALQREFDAQIEKFLVVMRMDGNSYYRCDKRIYYFSLENSLRISFSWANGQLSEPNDIYNKLKHGQAFLSPYSTWLISLEPKNDNENKNEFYNLRQFRNNIIEISLEGHGKYFQTKRKIVYETCNDQLDKFYRLDSVENVPQN